MKLAWLRHKRVLFILLAGTCIALLAAGLPLEDWTQQIQRFLESLGWWSLPTFVLIYVFVTILGLPNLVLILLAGSVFGLFKGVVMVSVADTLGAIACYGLGRTIARKRIKRWMSRNAGFKRLDQAVNRKGWKIILLSRLSPVVPSNILNYGFSCTKVNFWHYSFFTWLGMIPIIVLYTSVGSLGINLAGGIRNPRLMALQIGGVIFTIAYGIYMARLTKRILDQSDDSSGTNDAEK